MTDWWWAGRDGAVRARKLRVECPGAICRGRGECCRSADGTSGGCSSQAGGWQNLSNCIFAENLHDRASQSDCLRVAAGTRTAGKQSSKIVC